MSPQSQKSQDQIFRSQRKGVLTSGSSTKKNEPLDWILIFIIGGWLLVAAIFVFTIVICAGSGAGCGDIFLLALFPIFGIGALTFVYLIGSVIYVFSHLVRRQPIKRRHIVGMIITLALGIVPNVGPLWLAGTLVQQTYIQPAIERAEYNRNGGPTEALKAAIPLGNFEDATRLIDSCNVSEIWYRRYDYNGPEEARNLYIIVIARNNGSVAYETAPQDIYLPYSDKDRIVAAVKEKNDNLTGPYPNCANEIELRLPNV